MDRQDKLLVEQGAPEFGGALKRLTDAVPAAWRAWGVERWSTAQHLTLCGFSGPQESLYVRRVHVPCPMNAFPCRAKGTTG
jgi:hypothetical protein